MGKVSLEQLRHRFDLINSRRSFYEAKSEQKNGFLSRSDEWRHSYLVNPYLLGTPDERLVERYCQIMFNIVEIGQHGKISPVSITEDDAFARTFVHLQEEYYSRGAVMPSGAQIANIRERLHKYFEKGEPIGVTMFKGYHAPATPIVVKYGKREHLEPMLKAGRIKLSNANSYNKPDLIDAIRDDETSRTFFIPTFEERMAGHDHIDIKGTRINVDDDDIELPLFFDDYYLFSLCEHIHYRMPTDFNSDAAIVIRNPILFQHQLISTFLARFPDWEPMQGKVSYYDPYRDFPSFRVPQMSKHFGYSYQKEVRIVFRPRHRPSIPLEPIFLSIGSMTDYADLVSL